MSEQTKGFFLLNLLDVVWSLKFANLLCEVSKVNENNVASSNMFLYHLNRINSLWVEGLRFRRSKTETEKLLKHPHQILSSRC